MSAKITCPGCGAHTSAVFRAFWGFQDSSELADDEEPTGNCPYCGDPMNDQATFEAAVRQL